MVLETEIILNKQFIEIFDRPVNYTVSGEGEDLILIHGLGTSIESWVLNIKELSKNFRVYALDMPGFGDSLPQDEILCSEGLSDIVACFCTKLGIKKAHFVGHSFGGEVSLWIAIKYPKLVKSVILGASTGLCANVSNIEKFKNLIVDSVREPLYIMPRLLKAYTKAGPWRMLITIHKSRIHNICNYLDKVKCPVLVIYGSRDPVIVPGDDREALKKIKNSKVKMIDSTHGLIFDAPDEFNKQVKDFIATLN